MICNAIIVIYQSMRPTNTRYTRSCTLHTTFLYLLCHIMATDHGHFKALLIRQFLVSHSILPTFYSILATSKRC